MGSSGVLPIGQLRAIGLHMKKRQLSPLPLPRAWLTHTVEDVKVSDRELVLAGKRLNPGTKAYLRSTLLNAGWDADITDQVIAAKTHIREYLFDLAQEQKQDFDFNAALLRLKSAGFQPEALDRGSGATRYTQEVWDSFTRFPWWTAALRGKRQLMLVGKTSIAAKRLTAAFMRDLWANLGEAPEHRLPVVKRVNMLGFASADGVATFRDLADKVGVVVAYGLETPDFIYQMFSYASALAQAAPHAVLVYEAVPTAEVSDEMLLAAAQRSGFSYVFGVRRG